MFLQQKKDFILTEEFEQTLDILENTYESVFITGKAGTGKSSLLRHFIDATDKKVVVLAPTGVASLNVGGQTIHSFFRFPPSVIDPKSIQIDRGREDFFDRLEMVIIDEISMVRSDVMHGIDIALRNNRLRFNDPFGGVQMVFIGDLFQLPPVLRSNERDHILSTYGGQYFFDAPVFQDYKYHFKELNRVFRQSEEQQQFKTLLNNIRNNEVEEEDIELLKSRHIDSVGEQKNALFLTTRRNIAKSINTEKISKLRGKEYVFTAKLSGKYTQFKDLDEEKLDNKFPAPFNLVLKKNAQVMMLKNDPRKRWVNGSIGKVVNISDTSVTVKIDHNKYMVEKETWNEVKYSLDKETGGIENKITAGFTQFPMRLSYAITIHKSQGKTFDNVVIDVGTGAFAHGQVYVALSRCKTLGGISLNNIINNSDIIVDPRIIEYHNAHSTLKKPKKKQLAINPVREAIKNAIENKYRIQIEYQRSTGEVSSRELSSIGVPGGFGDFKETSTHIGAFCHLRGERRNFVVERILKVEVVG